MHACVCRKSKILQDRSLQMVVDWKQARAPAPQVNQPLPRHCGKLGGLRSVKTCLSREASLCNHGLTAFSNFLFSSVNTIQVKQLARCVHLCLIREGKEMNSPPLKKIKNRNPRPPTSSVQNVCGQHIAELISQVFRVQMCVFHHAAGLQLFSPATTSTTSRKVAGC